MPLWVEGGGGFHFNRTAVELRRTASIPEGASEGTRSKTSLLLILNSNIAPFANNS